MGRILREIEQCDPLKDHQRIVFLCSSFEFPFDITRALEFALFRTYAVPSIGAILKRTGEFTERAQKRYDDTDLILSQIYEFGYDSERGKAALDRMNQIHSRFKISNDDFLYVLSTFVFEPARWLDRFGWRRLTTTEQLAFFYFWREVGTRMRIVGIPENIADFEAFNVAYERDRFRFSEASREVAIATRKMLLNWFVPPALHPLAEPFVYALMDDRLLNAFGFPHPSGFLRAVVSGALRLRSRVSHWLPERRSPRLRSELKHRTYPGGYRTEELGPPPSGS